MAKQICKRRSQEIDFPKYYQGCTSLNTDSETPYCMYKGPEEKKTAKKSCCHKDF